MEKGVRVVDVREPHEYAHVRIPGSTLVPLGTLLQSPREFLQGEPALFVCSEGIRSAVACETAAAIGLEEVYNLEGGVQRWEAQGFPVEAAPSAERVMSETPAIPKVLQTDFLIASERLIRIHRFRYLKAAGCAWATLELTVEESLGKVEDPLKRCIARPDHSERVPRPEFIVYGESVEAALQALIEKLRARRPHEVFLPTG